MSPALDLLTVVSVARLQWGNPQSINRICVRSFQSKLKIDQRVRPSGGDPRHQFLSKTDHITYCSSLPSSHSQTNFALHVFCGKRSKLLAANRWNPCHSLSLSACWYYFPWPPLGGAYWRWLEPLMPSPDCSRQQQHGSPRHQNAHMCKGPESLARDLCTEC